MWNIVSRAEVANFARINEDNIDDIWYDTVLGIIETNTGWYSLEESMDVIDITHGHGSPILYVKSPINSVAYLKVDGATVSSSLYYASWEKIYIKNNSDRTYLSVIKPGIANVEISYNIGGITALPSNYQESLKAVLLLCIKELIAIPRNEGSDQTLRKYRPDRTMMPEETLKNYGVHGKINGIIRSQLPARTKVT